LWNLISAGQYSCECPLSRRLIFYTHGFPNLWGSMDVSDAAEASRIGEDGKRAGAVSDKVVAGVIRKQAFFWNTDFWLRVNV